VPAVLRSEGAVDLLAAAQEAETRIQWEAPGFGFPDGVGGPAPNVGLPAHVVAAQGELTLFADFDRAGSGGVPLYLVNRTGDAVTLSSQDRRVFVKLEFEDPEGHWARAQNHLFGFCGLSYFPVTLGPG
jgi:hypothetical protein